MIIATQLSAPSQGTTDWVWTNVTFAALVIPVLAFSLWSNRKLLVENMRLSQDFTTRLLKIIEDDHKGDLEHNAVMREISEGLRGVNVSVHRSSRRDIEQHQQIMNTLMHRKANGNHDSTDEHLDGGLDAFSEPLSDLDAPPAA